MRASTILFAFLVVAEVGAKSPHNVVDKMTQSTENDIVDTDVGKIRGLKITAVNGKSLWAFRGIPYAMPPVGKLRFAKPVAYPEEKNIIDARQQKALCMDNLLPDEKTSEDCLYLNIFLKDVNNQLATKKKVLVALYTTHLSNDPGSFVTEHDVIVVTVQHRLGLFGYLAVNSGGLPGNYGLWDKLSALKWVKNNIGAFGGDADDITVAGDEYVGCLAMTPMANGLFTKILARGGMVCLPLSSKESSDKDLIQISVSMNCWEEENVTDLSREDKLDIIQCLRSLPTIDPSKTELFNETSFKSWSSFVPVVDGDFLPKSFSALYKDDQYLEKIGFYEKKYFITVNNNLQYFWAEWFTSLKQALQKIGDDDDADNFKIWYDYSLILAKAIIAQRLNVDSVSDDLVSKIMFWYQTNTHLDPITELQTDLRYTVRTYDFLDTVARSTKSKVWLLHFNHYPDYLKEGAHGMIMNLDLLYLFDVDMSYLQTLDDPYVIGNFGKEDHQLKESFSALIAAFVKDGSPDAALVTQIPTGWPSYDLVGRHYLDFKSRPTVKRNWKKEIRDLWQQDVPYWAYQQMEKWHLEL